MNFLDASEPLKKGQSQSCWVNNATDTNMAVIGKRTFGTDGMPGVIIRAILVPTVGMTISMISCFAFWWRNQSSILQLTQSG